MHALILLNNNTFLVFIGLVFKPYCQNVNFTVKRHLENMIFQQKQELDLA